MRHLILMLAGGLTGAALSILIAAQMPSTGPWPVWSALVSAGLTLSGLIAGSGVGLWLERDGR